MFKFNYNTATDVAETEIPELKGIQEITDAKDILELLGDVIILNRYKDESAFEYLIKKVVDIAALCWNNKTDDGQKLQHTLIPYKIDIDDKETRMTTLNKFMMNLVFLEPLMKYIDDIDIDDYIITDDFLTSKRRGVIHNNTAKTLMEFGHPFGEVKLISAQVSLHLKELLLIFSHADAKIFTADNLFLDHYKESELIRNINNVEYDASMQTRDIVEENARLYKLLEEEMIKRGNPFFTFNKYTKIVKPKQMEECYINFSQVPDGKDIVPVIMNGNGFKAGYSTIPVLYAGAIAARVPDIMNNEYMGKAGYFGRNLWILSYGTLSNKVWDCGSKHKIPVLIDEMELDMKHGRYYSETKDDVRLKVLNKNDKHLIGKTLWFRSPCTCNLNEDVCHVCYGNVALKVGDLKGGFLYTTQKMTAEVGQKVLSAKHLLKADAEKVEFTGDYDQYFSVDSSTLMVADDKRFIIRIKEADFDSIGESLTFYVGPDRKPITISNYSSIYIPDEITDNMKDEVIDDVEYKTILNYKVIDLTNGVLCHITPINIMMTEKYFNIMRLFENNISKFDNMETVIRKLTEMFYGTISLLSVHGEVILSHLIRDANNKLLRPNWCADEMPEYVMLNLKTALKNTEAITTALSFQETKYHLTAKIFDERNAIKRTGPSGFLDYLFSYDTL